VGNGVGRALMIAALDHLRAAGYREATLWTAEQNVLGGAALVLDRALKEHVIAPNTRDLEVVRCEPDPDEAVLFQDAL
jgi:GNAT superfamily N-acetyltransferase